MDRGVVHIQRGLSFAKLLPRVPLITGPLVQWSLFKEPDWTEGTEGRRGCLELPAPPSSVTGASSWGLDPGQSLKPS